MLYDVGLRITYAYGNAAAAGRHILRLVPIDLPARQRLVAGHLAIDPEPDERLDRTDFFGNPLVECAFRAPHREISFEVQARVNRTASAMGADRSVPRHDLNKEITAHRGVGRQAPVHFLGPSPHVPVVPAISAYARDAAGGTSETVIATVRAIGASLHRDLKFAPRATTVDTPIAEAFSARHGVCQDFSHIMIAALRSLGIPAGYVSGLLRTDPPAGKERLAGADAMHAWVRAWGGNAMGWIEYDPTNDVFAANDHIVIARGRDYSDVSPVKGVLRGSGGQRSSQAVDVIPRGTPARG